MHSPFVLETIGRVTEVSDGGSVVIDPAGGHGIVVAAPGGAARRETSPPKISFMFNYSPISVLSMSCLLELWEASINCEPPVSFFRGPRSSIAPSSRRHVGTRTVSSGRRGAAWPLDLLLATCYLLPYYLLDGGFFVGPAESYRDAPTSTETRESKTVFFCEERTRTGSSLLLPPADEKGHPVWSLRTTS